MRRLLLQRDGTRNNGIPVLVMKSHVFNEFLFLPWDYTTREIANDETADTSDRMEWLTSLEDGFL